MVFFIVSFFLILLRESSFAARPDLDNTGGLTAVKNPASVNYSDIVFCPDNTWAYGFRVYYKTLINFAHRIYEDLLLQPTTVMHHVSPA